MAQRVQGTEDLFGSYMQRWLEVQDLARELFGRYGYEAIETPAIEQVDTFVHGIGESSDVVRKEMFRVMSGALLERSFEEGGEQNLKARQRLALRPEGTAGIVRAVVEHDLVPQGAAPVKVYYAAPMFRGERPQKGRLRQFHQLGVEAMGAPDASLDAELIVMLMEFFEALGFPHESLKLRINSMGDDTCRPAYRDLLSEFLHTLEAELCDDCRERANINPLRCFDCKNEGCQTIMSEAPLLRESLCDECSAHYEELKGYLDSAGVAYEEDPRLVRGLDYYMRTVFEIDALGAESVGAIGGGGRYDGLAELEGGRHTPGVGFALGFERIELALAELGLVREQNKPAPIFIALAASDLKSEAFRLAQELRAEKHYVEMDYQGRSLKSQFKLADKLGARYVIVLGPDELAAGQVMLRDMKSHEQRSVMRSELIHELS